MTDASNGTDESKSLQPVSEEDKTVVFDDFYAAIIGTIDATGKTGFTTEAGGPFPDGGDTLQDFMPGSRCSVSIHRELDARRIGLFVSTYGSDQGYTDYDEPLARVAAYWESQGWEPKSSGGAGGNMKAIATTTSEGTFIQYTAGAGGEDVEAKSPCLHAFNEDYDPDYSPPPQ
ncbi:hypothetical protein [Arthrobacter sp. L77]|uniref:hypothetical protein n=1 Tax=Arthrobacter sp. L77 TaxID=1496689 RepID=UPI0005BAEE54|nr:hypothetical protein [Arthrobacter sp. L77]